MKQLTEKHPEFEDKIQQVLSFTNRVEVLRKIVVPEKPSGKYPHDLPIHFSHYLNIIHLRFVSQVQLLVQSIKSENPEGFSIARNCLETIAVLVFVYSKVKGFVSRGDYVGAKRVLSKATLGARTEMESFLVSTEITDPDKRSYNILSCIDHANKLVAKDLRKVGENNKESKGFFRAKYDYLSEFAHPNFLGLNMYWEMENDQFTCQSTIRKEYLGMLLHAILPLLPLYLLYLKRSQELELEIKQSVK